MLSVEPNTILVTIDVKSLYTCIPHLEGIQACTEALQKAKKSNPSQPNTTVLGCLLEIVLKNNCFEFDGTYYKQLQGTAMGTKLAPAYANIFMGYLEHNILSQAPLNHHSTNVTLTISLSFGHILKQTLASFYLP